MSGSDHPLISVIIPTFNRRHQAEEAVASVLSQTFTDFELIVVDDGSTDDTAAMLESYAPDLTLIRQNNQGVSSARNKGVVNSRGKYLAFLDSDDLWHPTKLAVQTAFFKDKPDARICQTEEVWIRNGRRVNPRQRHAKPSGNIFIHSLELCLVSPSAVMLEKALFDEMGGFDETLPACEDYDLWLKISCRYPIYLIDDPLITKNGGHEDQLSAMVGLDKFRIQSLQKVLDTCPLSEKMRRATIGVLQNKCRIYAQGCNRRGRTNEAAHYLALAETYPEPDL
jgi:glycosyltransferase involved in cell wall biosynthesis